MIQGSSGCNKIRGHYTLADDKLSIKGVMIMSRMFCKGSIEAIFIKALDSMKSYKIKGEKLEIFDESGESLAQFETVYLY